MSELQSYDLDLGFSKTTGTTQSKTLTVDEYDVMFVNANICRYSILESVTISVTYSASISGSSGSLKIFIGGTQVGSVYESDGKGIDSYKTITTPNLKDYFKSGTKQPINPKGTIEFRFFANLPRKFSYKNFIIKYTFYTPSLNITTSVSPTGSGIVSPSSLTLNYPKQNYIASFTLTATPSIGYEFIRWSNNKTDNPNKFSVAAEASENSDNITAYFELKSFNITVSASVGGSVTGGGTYDYGSSIILTATPYSGYKFVKWSDGNTSDSRTVTVTDNAEYTAYFELDKTNNIYIGTSQPKSIYVGTSEVKAVYVGTTKIYG